MWLFVGNGKGVWKEMLKALLGAYFCAMSRDAVVKTPGQRPPSKGAPTAYVFSLKDKRIAFSDETEEGQQVDMALCLSLNGGGETVARDLYSKDVEFTLTHTTFIQTNNLPLIPPGGNPNGNNARRRIKVLKYPNTYLPSDKFDATNASHRPLVIGLKERMKAPRVIEQLMSLLARSSVEYYQEGLGEDPPAVVEATGAYFDDCDKLQQFLDKHCEIGAGFETLEGDFYLDYRAFSNEPITKEALMNRMKSKGHRRSAKPLNVYNKRELYYPRIKSIFMRN
jgi:phage/plasmid-associated DNA primase